MAECEYNPRQGRAKYEGEPCHNEATVSVGADGKWHLCESCAALPDFKRFRSRRPIKPSTTPPPQPASP